MAGKKIWTDVLLEKLDGTEVRMEYLKIRKLVKGRLFEGRAIYIDGEFHRYKGFVPTKAGIGNGCYKNNNAFEYSVKCKLLR